ncbi:protein MICRORCHIDIA 7-like [Andrographis paniculata]|uniref:protein MICRORCHIDIA 7-like n=1 Tax=Andrographis paniculata TaxID=175694 RepID=UPI0021E8E0F0|nr:protein MICRORCHIDIA 7-like [Andrographis paniculata]
MRDDMRGKMRFWHHNVEQKNTEKIWGRTWIEPEKSSAHSWLGNLEIIQQWWPFDKDLLHQFDFLDKQGTQIIIYNIWEDDEGLPELDFDTVEHILSLVRRPARNDGRGVVGVIEANFVEPAHDKQGFARTTARSRLESRLMSNKKNYWSRNCHLIGYAQRRGPEKCASPEPAIKFLNSFEWTDRCWIWRGDIFLVWTCVDGDKFRRANNFRKPYGLTHPIKKKKG